MREKSAFFAAAFVLTTGLINSVIVFASTIDGTIDSTYKYAWSENAGWINFGVPSGNVHVTDSDLTGYGWNDNYGWINLSPSASGVTNNGEGVLSGYAWGKNLGWINFSGIGIDYNGEFSGYATIENDNSRISFNCSNTGSCSPSNFKIKTDWRPKCNNGFDDDADGLVDYPTDPGCNSYGDGSENSDVRGVGSGGGGGGGGFMPEIYPQTKPLAILPAPTVSVFLFGDLASALSETFENIISFFGPAKPFLKPAGELVSKEPSPVFRKKWNLLSVEAIRRFVLAPLPKEIRNLAKKFPETETIFRGLKVRKITDVERLRNLKLTLPSLGEVEKEKLPTEIVFAKIGAGKINLSANVVLDEKGKVEQKITAISGKPIILTVRPEKAVKSVKGYVLFRAKTRGGKSKTELPMEAFFGSLIFANPVFARQQSAPINAEEKFILAEFEYFDDDGDGIYEAEIQAPAVGGEYEILTVMDYENPELGAREIILVAVIDPEGYVYESVRGRETRIGGAIASLFWLNPETKKYELWLAQDFHQENPQITGSTGEYSFLAPEGNYYLKIEAPGYLSYEGKPFELKSGSGIHFNIEMKTRYWQLKSLDWKVALLIVVVLLLLYNFYRDKIREQQAKIQAQ